MFALSSLIIWPAVVLFIFERQSIRRAIVTSFIGAWLFLPPIVILLPGVPDWSKTTATVFGVFGAVLLKQSHRLTGFRPRWFDLPMLGFCVCSFPSALSMGVGAYEGLSSVLDDAMRWGMPYLIGRTYLGDRAGARQLALGVAIGGMLYIPLCLAEIRLSPILKIWVYGLNGINNAEFGLRYGGYRPAVFLASGLEVGWWMCCATLCAYLLLAGRVTRRFFDLPGVPIAWFLALVTVACKSTGALAQVSVGVLLIWACRLTKSPLPIWALLLVAPTYCLTRSSGYCSGDQITSVASQVFPKDRIESLQYRFHMEDYLIGAALKHPILGWTRNGGFNPADEYGRTAAVTDGYWIIVFCCTGYVGLTLLNVMLLLPSAMFLYRYPVRTWFSPGVAPLLAFATILPLFMIDNLSNAMLNPIYAIAMGIVASCSDRRQQGDEIADADATHEDGGDRLAEAIARQARLVRARPYGRNVEDLARLHARQARVMAERGQADAALAERFAAEDLWASIAPRVVGTRPEAWPPERSANANDLAWLLASAPGADPADLAEARRLAEAALESEPARAPYWNTLGIVCYRQADHHRAIQALSRSVTLDVDGGTAFDFYFLALANRALGYHQAADTWYRRAEAWDRARPEMTTALEAIRAEAAAGSA